ncbi:hypothetical protein GCM10009617_27380 [Leifsonia poae]|uniref:Uncharacterized protein n=1 Tax=Leifsonia poae TaxID=110933 RepID=A0A9W6M0T6_9MICO|nr:hypothetical protein GCM10017584_26460 [Leifsonia poae]
MTNGGLQRLWRSYRITYLLWVGWGVLAAGLALLLSYFLTSGTYPLPAAGAWNLAFPIGFLMLGSIVTTIGVLVTVRKLRQR